MALNFYKLKTFVLCILLFQICVLNLYAQSTNQDFPTPVTTNEINGKIAARDIGDARLTAFFYTFDGTQGDIFINVEATNLNGDIDVFTAGNLRPLTKISLFAGDTTIETGRVIYLRKSEKLILRVEGRTPNDNAATFRIKFAGSFVASTLKDDSAEPKLPEVKTNENAEIKVNSVGTIIEVKPKPTPKPKETVAEIIEKDESKSVEPKPEKTSEIKEEKKPDDDTEAKVEKTEKTLPEKVEKPKTPRKNRRSKQAETTESKSKSAAEVTESKEVKADENKSVKSKEKVSETKPEKISEEKSKLVKPTKNSVSKTRNKPPEKPKEPEPNPLENVRLTVLFKDGTKFEKPMPEVLRFSVDKGVLTVITKDGKIERFQIVNVAKMTVE